MNSSVLKPSIARIVAVDHIALLTVVCPVVFWVMALALTYFGHLPNPRGDEPFSGLDIPFFISLALITTFICIPLLIWRVWHFQSVFINGEAVNGKITKVSYIRYRGRLEFTYTFAGQQYHATNSLRLDEAPDFHEGDEVLIMVSRVDPKRSYIQGLFV